ncbi:MAG: hypothetical protein IJF94_05455 [Eubacterium sp.]|nr:hypothetical protein [Eubacterium sp.]
MYYEDFSELLRDKLQEIVDDKLDDGKVVIRNVVKNNSVRRRAISIVRKEEKATPTIYIKGYYDAYKDGRDIDDISEEVFDVYLAGLNRFKQEIDIDEFSDFEKIKDRIYFKLVNYKMNEALLEEIPYEEYLDLAEVYYILVSENDDSSATALIYNFHMEHWGVELETIKKCAYENSIKELEPTIEPIEDVVMDMIIDNYMDAEGNLVTEDTVYDGMDMDSVQEMVREEVEKLKPDNAVSMYVLSNKKKYFGAACIRYPGVLRDFANQQNENVYVIPSSVHEVILVPHSEGNRLDLENVLQDVNRNEMDQMEVLSDHVYLFDRENEEII